MKGVLVKGRSEWAIYDGRTNANLNTISKSKKYSSSLNDGDKQRVKELRKWATTFLAKNSSK